MSTQAKISFTRRDLCAIGVLFLFCLYLFRDIVLSGHLLFGDDFITFYLGMKKFLYDEVRLHQEIPFWNPYLFGGMPFWAHFESAIFYPLGFLFYLLSPEKAYGYTMAMHFFLAGVFMHLLVRSLGVSAIGGVVSSAIFACNGFVMAILFLGHLSPVESYTWLPLVIYFVNRAVHADRIGQDSVIAGALWGIQILAGAPQDAFYTFLAASLFLVCSSEGVRTLKASVPRLFAVAATVFVVGACLSAIQILPALELIGESVRAALNSYDMVTLASYPPQGIITVLLPHFFGNYANGSVWVGNMPWSIPQQNLYVGILSMVLLGFVSFQHNVTKRVKIFGVLLAVVSLILALGHHSPVYKFLYSLPGFDRFRAPSKIMVLWVFSLSLLAGIGMDGLLSHLKEGRFRRLYPLFLSVVSLACLLMLFYFAPSSAFKIFSPFVLPEAIPAKMSDAVRIVFAEMQRLTLTVSAILLLILLMRKNLLSRSIGGGLLCALLLADLGIVHGQAVRHGDATYQRIAQIRKDLDASLGKDKSGYRVGAFEHSLGPNLEIVLGYQTVNGFTALFPSRYYEYIHFYTDGHLPEGWVYFFYGRHPKARFMDLLNLKYEILYEQRIYAIRNTWLPRALLVPGQEVLERSEILPRLSHPDFDPKKTVLFEKEDPPSALHPRSETESGPPGEAHILSYRPDRLVLETDSPSFRYLFLSEMYYPGWKAFIDGQPTRILRGNYLFRVLEVPKGRHSILLEFNPWTIRVGAAITSLTFLLAGAFVLRAFLKKRL